MRCKKDIENYKPNAVILVDLSGINLRLAKFLKSKNIKNIYYISPKIWAWKEERALKIKQTVDHMMVILPFEIDFYKRFGFDVDFVGNPIADGIKSFVPQENFKDQLDLQPDKKVVALLPGSRKQEVRSILSLMTEVAGYYKDVQFIVAGVSFLDKSLYDIIKEINNVFLVFDKAYDVLSIADAAIVTSGTATLETALFEIPQVVVYKTDRITYWYGKKVIKVKYLSLANLIMDKLIIKEFIQHDCTEQTIIDELNQLLFDQEYIRRISDDYRALKEAIGDVPASENAANCVVKYLEN